MATTKLDGYIFEQDTIGNIHIYPQRWQYWLRLGMYAILFLFIYPFILLGAFSAPMPFRCFGILGIFFLPYMIYVYIVELRTNFRSKLPIFIGILPTQVEVGDRQIYMRDELKHICIRRERIQIKPRFTAGNFDTLEITTNPSSENLFDFPPQFETEFFATLQLKNDQQIPLFQAIGQTQGNLVMDLAQWIADSLKIPLKDES